METLTLIRSRNKKGLKRQKRKIRDHKLIVVATEGADTEKLYLELFDISRVKIIPIPNRENKSAPQHIISNLNEFIQNGGFEEEKEKYEFIDEDEFWLMIDVDRWTRNNTIHNFVAVVREAKSKGFQLAISNPSIEMWLYLHFQDLKEEDHNQNNKYFEEKLKDYLGGYSKTNIPKDLYLDKVEDAIRRAKKLDQNSVPSMRWPENPGSHVYKLVENILKGS
ncbi:RloB family protein [Bacillus cereus]|uniref:RloB family protein n=1 Tax=Bacillus cereus TaxID=1396 RepID=UPI000470AA06|nr:RloB family protein [Bacillus cereus]MDZ4556632.1 RloB family protein [Bacillus cereus]QBZ23587.1 hypothetical protein FORC085_517 [Bacillus cereus]